MNSHVECYSNHYAMDDSASAQAVRSGYLKMTGEQQKLAVSDLTCLEIMHVTVMK